MICCSTRLASPRIIFSTSFLLILLCLISTYIFAAPSFPSLTDRVIDQANILSLSTESELKNLLSSHENETGNQVVIVTLKSLGGYEIADYGYQLGRHWGIGQEEKDNGVLLIIAPKERKIRIEVGYGLEGTLTDALSSYIINQDIAPYFKQEAYDTGVLNGTKAIIQTLNQEPSEYSPKPERGKQSMGNSIFTLIPLFFPLIFLGEIFGARKNKKIFGSLAFSGFFGLLAWAISISIIISIGVFVVVFFMSHLGKGGGGSNTGGGVYFPGGFGGGSGGFGGGGFGGGGGGFGGGGASGSW